MTDAAPHVEVPEPERGSFLPSWLAVTPYWALSALLHLILFLLLLVWIVEPPPDSRVAAPISLRAAPPPPRYDPTARRDVKKTPQILDVRKVQDPLIKRKIDTLTPDIPRGMSFDNVTNLELGGASIHDAIGVSGGAAGAYGERWGKGSLWREGGNEATEDAVRAALEWLVRHQSADGSWKAAAFTDRCRGTCKNIKADRYGDGKGSAQFDVGVTALSVLAIAGYGHTHRWGIHEEYVQALDRAVRYLKSVQVVSPSPDENGKLCTGPHGKWIYEHALATMALGELLAMSGDVIGLKKHVQAAVELCLRAQNPGSGWRYGVRPGDSDTSVTGWIVLALKTSRNARIVLPPEAFEASYRGALDFLRGATAGDGRTGYLRAGDPDNRARGWPEPYPFSRKHSCMTAVSVLCRLFAGEQRSHPSLRRGVDILLAELPSWQEQDSGRLSTINYYYWYYGSYALFQYGGEAWTRWNAAMLKTLLASQRTGGCEDGSWDTAGEWSNQGGRVYATAICAMTLEVYYRFRRLEEGISF